MPKFYSFEEKKDHKERVHLVKDKFKALKIHSYTKQFPSIDPVLFRNIINFQSMDFEVLAKIEQEVNKLFVK